MPETLLGHLNEDGTVSGGIPIPGLASWLPDPSTGRATVVQGLDAVPPDQRPTVRDQHRPSVLGHHGGPRDTAVLVVGVVRCHGSSGAACRRASCSSGWAASGVLAVITMEAGWVVTEVGRQPWIVYNYMKVDDAVTGNTGCGSCSSPS